MAWAGTDLILYQGCNSGCPDRPSGAPDGAPVLCTPSAQPVVPRCTCINLGSSDNNSASGLGYSIGASQIRLFDGANCTVSGVAKAQA